MADTVVSGRIDEFFHQVAAAVVEEVLKRLGHHVNMVEENHTVMYPMLQRGELDVFSDAWLPGGHEVYWEMVKDVAIEVAPLYDNALFFWAVPGYVPEDLVSSLHDLAKPEVAERFTTQVVTGTKASAGLSMRSERLVTQYGLDAVGWHHDPQDIFTIIDNVNSRIAAGDWFVTPMWQPMFLNEVHDLRPLADPLGIFPPPDRASLIAHRDSWAKLPKRTRDVLSSIRYTVADVNLMDVWVAIDGLDPNESARRWLDENSYRVADWGL